MKITATLIYSSKKLHINYPKNKICIKYECYIMIDRTEDSEGVEINKIRESKLYNICCYW